jgi:hypothetical protein
MKRYKVILNGQALCEYERVSYANRKVGEIISQDWFDNDGDLVEIYDTETGEYIYTNEED